MSKNTKYVVLSALLGLSLQAVPAYAERVTLIERPNGDRTLVRTDGMGTRVDHQSGGSSVSGGDRHTERVRDYTKDGGRIIRDRSN